MTVTEGPTRPDGTRIDKEAIRRKYVEERDKRLRADGNDQYLRLTGQLAHYLEDPYTPVTERDPGDRPRDGRLHRRRVRRPGHRRPAQGGRRRRRPHHREGRRLRGHLVLEPLPRRPVRHGVVRVHAAARGDRAHADREVRPRAGDPRALPAHRQALRPLRQRPVPHRGRPTWSGTTTDRAGSSAPTAATSSPRSSSPWAPGPCTCRSCRASRASRRSPATRSTRADGTTTTPAATRRAPRWTSWPTSGSPSSAPAPRPCSACRTWRGRARSSTSSSARRRRSTSATTGRPIRSGSPRWPRRAGSSAGSRTSPPTRPAAWPTRTW